jgi:uncharacterized membrane protein
MIHEGLIGRTMATYFGRGEGIMYYTWYKVYIPIVLIVGLIYLPFLIKLQLRYSLRLVFAGAVFLGGAIGFDFIESYLVSRGIEGKSITRLFEETGEMLGVVLVIHTLLLYLADKGVDLMLGFRQRIKS